MKSLRNLAIVAVLSASTLVANAAPKVVGRAGGVDQSFMASTGDFFHLTFTIGGVSIYTLYAASAAALLRLL